MWILLPAISKNARTGKFTANNFHFRLWISLQTHPLCHYDDADSQELLYDVIGMNWQFTEVILIFGLFECVVVSKYIFSPKDSKDEKGSLGSLLPAI